jgi:hypothetical protein
MDVVSIAHPAVPKRSLHSARGLKDALFCKHFAHIEKIIRHPPAKCDEDE